MWKGAELFAQYLAFSQAAPACPDCRLVCPGLSCPAANLSCPSYVAPNLTCQAPLVQLACPEVPQAPAINLSCPVVYPLRAEEGILGYDLPSLTVGVLVGSVGGVGATSWVRRRPRRDQEVNVGVEEAARAQVAQLRRRPPLQRA